MADFLELLEKKWKEEQKDKDTAIPATEELLQINIPAQSAEEKNITGDFLDILEQQWSGKPVKTAEPQVISPFEQIKIEDLPPELKNLEKMKQTFATPQGVARAFATTLDVSLETPIKAVKPVMKVVDYLRNLKSHFIREYIDELYKREKEITEDPVKNAFVAADAMADAFKKAIKKAGKEKLWSGIAEDLAYVFGKKSLKDVKWSEILKSAGVVPDWEFATFNALFNLFKINPDMRYPVMSKLAEKLNVETLEDAIDKFMSKPVPRAMVALTWATLTDPITYVGIGPVTKVRQAEPVLSTLRMLPEPTEEAIKTVLQQFKEHNPAAYYAFKEVEEAFEKAKAKLIKKLPALEGRLSRIKVWQADTDLLIASGLKGFKFGGKVITPQLQAKLYNLQRSLRSHLMSVHWQFAKRFGMSAKEVEKAYPFVKSVQKLADAIEAYAVEEAMGLKVAVYRIYNQLKTAAERFGIPEKEFDELFVQALEDPKFKEYLAAFHARQGALYEKIQNALGEKAITEKKSFIEKWWDEINSTAQRLISEVESTSPRIARERIWVQFDIPKEEWKLLEEKAPQVAKTLKLIPPEQRILFWEHFRQLPEIAHNAAASEISDRIINVIIDRFATSDQEKHILTVAKPAYTHRAYEFMNQEEVNSAFEELRGILDKIWELEKEAGLDIRYFERPYLTYLTHIIHPDVLAKIPQDKKARLFVRMLSLNDRYAKARKMLMPVNPHDLELLGTLMENKIISPERAKAIFEMPAEEARTELARRISEVLPNEKLAEVIYDLEKQGKLYFPSIFEINKLAREGKLIKGWKIEHFLEPNPLTILNKRIDAAGRVLAKARATQEAVREGLQRGILKPIEDLQEIPAGWKQGPAPFDKYLMPDWAAELLKETFTKISSIAANPPLVDAISYYSASLLRMWKYMVTLVWPAFHARNARSNVFLMMLGGWNPFDVEHLKIFKDMIKLTAIQLAREGRLPRALVESKLLGTRVDRFLQKTIKIMGKEVTYESLLEELHRVGARFGFFGEERAVLGGKIESFREAAEIAASKLMEYAGKPTKWGETLGELIETPSRATLYVIYRKMGFPVEEARRLMNKYMMNYIELPKAVKIARRHFVPFAAWYYNIVPRMFEEFLRRPRLWKAFEHARAYSAQEYGIPPFALTDMFKRMFGVFLGLEPKKYKSGRKHLTVQFFSFANDIPIFSFLLPTDIDWWISIVRPEVKSIVEISVNRSTWRKQPIAQFKGEKKELTVIPFVWHIWIDAYWHHLINNMLRFPREFRRLEYIFKRKKVVGAQETWIPTSAFLNLLKVMLGMNLYTLDPVFTLEAQERQIRDDRNRVLRMIRKGINREENMKLLRQYDLLLREVHRQLWLWRKKAFRYLTEKDLLEIE